MTLVGTKGKCIIRVKGTNGKSLLGVLGERGCSSWQGWGVYPCFCTLKLIEVVIEEKANSNLVGNCIFNFGNSYTTLLNPSALDEKKATSKGSRATPR